MRILIRLLIVVVVFFIGSNWQMRQIQAQCDDPVAPTVIQGHTYMCVTKEQWNEVAERIFRMGFATGVKSERGST